MRDLQRTFRYSTAGQHKKVLDEYIEPYQFEEVRRLKFSVGLEVANTLQRRLKGYFWTYGKENLG